GLDALMGPPWRHPRPLGIARPAAAGPPLSQPARRAPLRRAGAFSPPRRAGLWRGAGPPPPPFGQGGPPPASRPPPPPPLRRPPGGARRRCRAGPGRGGPPGVPASGAGVRVGAAGVPCSPGREAGRIGPPRTVAPLTARPPDRPSRWPPPTRRLV